MQFFIYSKIFQWIMLLKMLLIKCFKIWKCSFLVLHLWNEWLRHHSFKDTLQYSNTYTFHFDIIWNTGCYTGKKVTDFPVPSQDVINQTRVRHRFRFRSEIEANIWFHFEQKRYVFACFVLKQKKKNLKRKVPWNKKFCEKSKRN